MLAEARLEQRRGVGNGGAAREVEDARAATWLGLGLGLGLGLEMRVVAPSSVKTKMRVP